MVTHAGGFGVFGKMSPISINVQTQKDWLVAATIYWWATLALGWVFSHNIRKGAHFTIRARVRSSELATSICSYLMLFYLQYHCGV